MGFFSRLLGLGVAAGATYAAVKVAQKYEDNKAGDIAAGEAGDEAAKKDVLGDIGKAVTDVYSETAAKVKDAAQNAGVDTEKVASTIKDAGKAVGEAGKAVAGKVKDAAGDYYDQAKDKAGDIYKSAKEAVTDAFGGEKKTDDGACACETAESCSCESKPEDGAK